MIRWVYAFIDRPAEKFEAAAAFWTAVTKSTLSPRRGGHDEFATLLPPDGDPHVKLQAVGSAGGMHLDLAVDDVHKLAERAVGLGASEVCDHGNYVVLASPAGQLFCSVPWRGEQRRAAPTRLILGATTRLDQVVVDVAPSRVEGEAAFWGALTGWPVHTGSLAEFTVVQQPDELPVRILIQRIGEERPTSGHLDLACSDRTIVRAFHEREGASLVVELPLWTVMRDPAGGLYCLTARDPVTGRRPA
jgi:hypothetical protein